MNRLTIKLFATLRERARAAELSREFPDGTTVGEIWSRLLGEFPTLGGHHDGVAFAVNQEYVKEDFRPRNDDEVAFIPPVSGGVDAVGLTARWVGPITIGRGRVDIETWSMPSRIRPPVRRSPSRARRATTTPAAVC